MTYLTYPSLVKLQFQGLDCRMEVSGVSYLRVDLGQPCNSPRYASFVWINVGMIALTQTIPLFYLWRCYRVRDELNPKVKF